MQNAYKFKNCVGDPDILLSPDTLLSPTKGGALSRAHGRPTIISSSKKSSGRAGGGLPAHSPENYANTRAAARIPRNL
jgi:hypothetical protein